MPMGTLESADEATFDKVMNLNVKGPLFLVQKAVPHMPLTGGGRVIFLSTGLNTASGVSPAYLLYVASKGAVDQLTRALSKDLAKKNITVNAVAPGPTATDLFFEGKPEQVVGMLQAQSPFNRLGTPEEIAEVVTFLAGEGSRWISGQVIRANGANMV
jgi:3-oxoacyl-[acyl-carrier protein] reductase